MKVAITSITPDMAAEMLTHNYEDNRNIRASYVRQLAAVMKSGRYVSENGQTIVFGEDDGILYDGQHRLRAIDESGCAQTFIVVHITNGKEAYKTIDNGAKRNAADFITLPSRTHSATIAKYLACVEWGQAPLLSCLQGKINTKDHVDRGLVIAYAEQHGQSVIDSVRAGKRMREAVGCGAQSIYGFFTALVRYCEMDSYLDEYVDEFVKAASSNATITATKTIILKTAASAKTSGIDNKWLFGTLLDSYFHFCEMDHSTMFNKQQVRINQYSKLVQQRRDDAK